MGKYITFDDLNFGPHPLSSIGDGNRRIQAVHKFESGYVISVVGGDGIETFEVAIMDPNGDFTRLDGWYDDVRGWLSKSEVNDILYQLQISGFVKIKSTKHNFI